MGRGGGGSWNRHLRPPEGLIKVCLRENRDHLRSWEYFVGPLSVEEVAGKHGVLWVLLEEAREV